MAKYRIIKYQYSDRNIKYKLQKKILGFFWRTFCSTSDDAEMAIKMDDEKYHIKTIININ